MEFYKFRNTYMAIDLSVNKIIQCEFSNKNKSVATYTDDSITYHVINKSLTSKKITEAEFMEQFSKAVEFFHNKTPFA